MKPCTLSLHNWDETKKHQALSANLYLENRTCLKCGSKQARLVYVLKDHQETTGWLYYA